MTRRLTLNKRRDHMHQTNRYRSPITWLLTIIFMLCSPVVQAEDSTEPPAGDQVEDGRTEAAPSPNSEQSLKDNESGISPAAKTEKNPPIETLKDGEVVIDRDGVETVMDEDEITPTAVTKSADPTIEEIVIIGIQRALEGALEEKRQTTNLTEIINAENIGKLADENVAEVLENIPGVQITREGGIGAQVSIRGSDQNRVEINGRGTLSDGDTRGGVRFSDLPAALVRSLTVTKVPTADMVEGSIGGTINVKTFRGLKLKEPLLVFNPRAEYGDNSDTWSQNYSGTAGNKFETRFGDVGVILTVSHNEKTVREDVLRVSPSVRQGWGANKDIFPGPPSNKPRFQNCCDFDGDPDTFNPYYYPGYSETLYGTEDRENTTAQGSLEWQVSDSFKAFTDVTYSSINVLQRSQLAASSYGAVSTLGCRRDPPYSLPDNPPCKDNPSDRELDGIDFPAYAPQQATFGLTEVAGIQVPILNSGCIGCGIRNLTLIDPITPTGKATDDGLQIRPGNRALSRDTESYVAAVGGEWLDDQWLIEVEASASGTKTNSNAFNTTFQYNDPNNPDWQFDSNNSRVRVPFIYDVRDDVLSYGPLPYGLFKEAGVPWGPGTPSPAANLMDPAYYSLYLARDSNTRFDNDLYAQRIDIERFLENPFFSSALFGFRSSQRSTERIRTQTTTDPFPGLSGTDLQRFLIPTPGDFFSFNSDGVYLDNFLTPNANQSAGLREELVRNAGLGANTQLAPPQGFSVDENTYSAYLRMDFESDYFKWPIKGNFGVRFVHTDQTAAGNQLNNDQTFSPISVNQNYNNWLPSASMIISPLEQVQLRLGYAQILRRPSFAQLAPTFEYPLNENQAVQVGDPYLQPTTAHQFDAGIEWYFLKGSVFSVGYFYKDLESVIGTDLTYQAICNPIAVGDLTNNPCPNGNPGVLVDKITWSNLPGGSIQGVELALQHKFNYLPDPLRGFGIIANYAYQDGERDDSFSVPGFLKSTGVEDAEFPLNFRRLSEHSYNITLYYEKPKYGFSGRVRYTWRSGFLITESSDISNGQPLYRSARGQLNANLSLRLPRPLNNFTLILWGINLTKEQSVETGAFPTGPIVRMSDADRRFAIGLRARF
ncbi:MAG: hypothetical protein CL917_01780 [Deltaproteobacteria bacterium]|nr:hypothetical protein [Deltaproteobacteria bacterium]